MSEEILHYRAAKESYMSNLSRHFILGSVLALSFHLPLQAQTPANPPADTTATAANAAPSGQAPDELTKKISELVHVGKYAEAQQLNTGLLLAYPHDQRLIKAKTLLEKLLAPEDPANGTPGSSRPTNNRDSVQPESNTTAAQLTGIERIDYDALIELARQAQQAADLSQQNALLLQFMDQSGVFLSKHPTEMLIWQLRAASAISLNDPMAGYEAGQKILAAGGADSNDSNLRRLLAQLKNKGWLDKQNAEKLYEQQRYVLVAFLGEAADKPTNINLRTKLVLDMTVLLQSQYPSRQIHYTTPARGDPPPILTVTVHVHDTTLSPCTYSMLRNEWKCPAQTFLAVAASLPQGWQFNKTYRFAGGTSGIGWGVARTPLTADEINTWISQGVIGVFKGILDADAVRAALANPTPSPAVFAVPSSAPIDNAMPLAPAHASQPAVQSSVLMNTFTPEPAVPTVHSYAPVDTAAPLAAASNTTVLHVYRPHHLIAARQKPDIYIDGRKITPIANSQEIRMVLTPGKHTISVSKKYLENELPINNLDMAAGNEYWIRVDISAGAWAAHSKLYTVSTDQAKLESKRMEEINIGGVF